MSHDRNTPSLIGAGLRDVARAYLDSIEVEARLRAEARSATKHREDLHRIFRGRLAKEKPNVGLVVGRRAFRASADGRGFETWELEFEGSEAGA